MTTKEVIMIPTPTAGHIVSMVEFAKQLTSEPDKPIAVTLLIIHLPHRPPPPLPSTTSIHHPNIRFIHLPHLDPPSPDLSDTGPEKFITVFIQNHKSHVKDAIFEHVVAKSIPLAGIIVDMFCSSMIDVANELGVPFYVFLTSGALFLSFLAYLPIHVSITGREYFLLSDSVSDSIIPARFLPSLALKEDSCSPFVFHVNNFKQADGIIINTFVELEADTIASLESDFGKTKIYTVGPLIKQEESSRQLDPKSREIISWLNEQPTCSVVFLCFGSNGGFKTAQLVEIATALENSGQRFLWSIQKPPSKKDHGFIREYDDISEVLPEGFLYRTKSRGLVCGWAPQVDILSHEAVGGFVSHCGWNSILESLWNGVPIAAWPLYAEQHLNGYRLVKEMGLAVEMKLDYRSEDTDLIVRNDEIEKSITCLMNAENPVRKKVKKIGELSRRARLQGGSSFKSMESFVADILA